MTLIELIVTLAILSLLLMVAAPNVSAWMRNTQIRNVATSILTGVQRARAEAIRRNAPMRFSLVSLSDSAVMDGSCKLSEAGVSWVVSQDNPAGLCGVAVSETTAPRIVDKHASGSGGKWVT
ncbi:MAG: GspH/FimT family pseudopilin, partial [Burkholderiaceae bacterium]|nr:GspH/FimT family pseudopilin [Burkholderiaceae bacterium]